MFQRLAAACHCAARGTLKEMCEYTVLPGLHGLAGRANNFSCKVHRVFLAPDSKCIALLRASQGAHESTEIDQCRQFTCHVFLVGWMLL